MTITGEETTAGHKTCPHCGELKPLDEFGKLTRAKDGHDYLCKPCRRTYNRARYAANRDKRKADVRRVQQRDKRELEWYREHYPQEGQPWGE